jgi:hypothetical protein
MLKNFNLPPFHSNTIILWYKKYYDGNYCGMTVSNAMVIYPGSSTLEITGIFITLTVKYSSI